MFELKNQSLQKPTKSIQKLPKETILNFLQKKLKSRNKKKENFEGTKMNITSEKN